MLNYTLFVIDGPENNASHARALGFAGAVLAAGHHLNRVFFFGPGVRVALFLDNVTGKLSAEQWRTVCATSGTELALCSASADYYGLTVAPEGFLITGLGVLMEAGFDSDRVISFG